MRQVRDDDGLWTSQLQAVGRGCRAAFTQLHDASSPRLYATVCRIQRDRAEADDVLQEVYIKVWTRAGTFDPAKAAAGAWLHGIATHAALDSLRRARCRPGRPAAHADTADEQCEGLPCTAPGPPDLLLRRQVVQDVRRSLMLLSAEAREVVTLGYEHDLSQSKTATRLKRPLGTVKSLMRRSLLALKPPLLAHR